MKLEREPVFGQLTLSYKPDYKPFDHKEITLDSAGLQSENWIVKESQNRVVCESENSEEDAGQNDVIGLTASRLDCSQSVDDLDNCKKGEVRGFVSPFTLSSEKLESLEKQSDYYMDKSVMEYDLPELIVCYKESSCNTIKDICIDEGVPSQEKIWFENDVDEKEFCTYLSPDEDQKKQLLEEQMDIVMKVPDSFKFSAQKYDVKDFVIPCDAKDLVQRGEAMYDASEKTASDVSIDMCSPANELSTQDLLRTQNLHTKFSDKDSNEAVQDTVQISSEKGIEVAQTESTVFVSATEESNDIEKETLVKLDPVPSAGQFNCLVDESSDSSKVENGSITVGLDRSAPVSISRFANLDPVPSTEGPNCLVAELSDNYIAEKGGSSTYSLDCSPPLAISRDVYGQDGFGEHLKTRNMSEDDSDDICDSKIVSSKVQPCLAPAPVTTAREEAPENGACQLPGTSNRPMVDEDISDSEIVPSHVQHSLEPATIASEDVLIQVQRDTGESSFSAGVPFSSLINYTEPIPHSDTLGASSKVQHDQGESSFSAAGHSSSLINTSGPSDSEGFLVQRDLGDSSFSAAGQFLSSGPITYSGSISLRSDSSATSTRSFAFPVIHPPEPFCSPVRMVKADRRLLRKHRGWKRGIFCCSF